MKMLKQKLDVEELALLEIVEDSIWFGEFMRTTGDGEIDKNVWPKPVDGKSWRYRDYQRQFLSDTSEFILYTGGRAIGKCQPSGARVYTTKGYKTIGELSREKYFITYALDPKSLDVVQRRAVITKDKLSPAYTLRTASGHEIVATKLHPILTPDGYKLMADIDAGDYIAVTTRLPHESQNASLQWHELRILGYIFLAHKYRVSNRIAPRYKKIGAELEVIAERMLLSWNKDFDGTYLLDKRKGPYKHPINSLLEQMGQYHPFRQYGAKKIPNMIKEERLDNIQVFLEAVFAQFGELSQREITLKLQHIDLARDFQELLLRFGIESSIEDIGVGWKLSLLDYRAVYRFWKTFLIPGVTVGQLELPPATEDATDFMRYDRVVNKYLSHEITDTYAVHVYEHNNYIGDNIYVHNSVVLEDKLIHAIVNSHDEFPVTPEMVFVTANQAQMSMPQSRFISRFTASPFLKDFLKGKINKSIGIMEFPRKSGGSLKFWMRIAGSNGEQNMVGLHLPRIVGDECQLFPLPAYTQLMPAYNQWEPKRQQIWGGVPNGLRNSVLYLLDMQSPKYKKYRIPAPNNVMGYSYENYMDDLRRYGGEADDRFQQLVLGRHGAAAYQVIPRESITIETYPFYNQRYNSTHVSKGQLYTDVLQRQSLPSGLNRVMFAIDPGFADPTIIQIIGRDEKNIWRAYNRIRLTRIDFNEQQNIIHWLDDFYNPDQIVIDIGAGGNGASIMHNMMYGETYKGRNYEKRFMGVQFKENVLAGYDDNGEELFQEAKSFAATELARIIQDGKLRFSEVDNEGLSQMERVAKKKSMNGRDTFFVISEKGASGKGGVGADEDDHIFASFICFTLASREDVLNPYAKKLGKPKGSHT
jgi:hypothetical protein